MPDTDSFLSKFLSIWRSLTRKTEMSLRQWKIPAALVVPTAEPSPEGTGAIVPETPTETASERESQPMAIPAITLPAFSAPVFGNATPQAESPIEVGAGGATSISSPTPEITPAAEPSEPLMTPGRELPEEPIAWSEAGSLSPKKAVPAIKVPPGGPDVAEAPMDRRGTRKAAEQIRLKKSIASRRRRKVEMGIAEPDLTDPLQLQALKSVQEDRAVISDDKAAALWNQQVNFDKRAKADLENMDSRLSSIVSEFELGLNTLTDTNVF